MGGYDLVTEKDLISKTWTKLLGENKSRGCFRALTALHEAGRKLSIRGAVNEGAMAGEGEPYADGLSSDNCNDRFFALGKGIDHSYKHFVDYVISRFKHLFSCLEGVENAQVIAR